MTNYVILKHDESAPGHWKVLGNYATASSPRRALASTDLADGDYIAVPARSWKILKVTVEQTTKVTIG